MNPLQINAKAFVELHKPVTGRQALAFLVVVTTLILAALTFLAPPARGGEIVKKNTYQGDSGTYSTTDYYTTYDVSQPQKVKIFTIYNLGGEDKTEDAINKWLADTKEKKHIIKWDLVARGAGTAVIIYHYMLIPEPEKAPSSKK